MEAPKPLGAGDLLRRRAIPFNLGPALQLQEIAGFEVDEQQRGPRFGDQIAEGVEVAVAAKIGDRQYIAVDANEARPAAAMRNIRSKCRAVAGPGTAGNEESVGACDGGSSRNVQMGEGFSCPGIGGCNPGS